MFAVLNTYTDVNLQGQLNLYTRIFAISLVNIFDSKRFQLKWINQRKEISDEDKNLVVGPSLSKYAPITKVATRQRFPS